MATARLRKLDYWYPRSAERALEEVDLTLDGGTTLVAGPSGGGKSTLLRVFNGLVPQFHGGRVAGRAEVMGMDVVETPTRRLARSVGFVFQDPELQAVYDTVEREVAFALENLGCPSIAMPARVEQALHEAGVSHLAGRRMRTLSGGERQRVALASALVAQPRLIVLDEPTSQLDQDGAELVLEAISRVAESGRSVVVSEHRLERLAGVASAVVEVEGGRARAFDPREWTTPALDGERAPRSAGGAEAWSMTCVSAGFGGEPVFDRVSLSGRQGEVLALTGPNGGGKTTLLRVIAGTLAPREGHIERGPGRIAYLPQNPAALLHRPTLRAEVELTLRRAGETGSPEAILDELGIGAVATRYPRDLSSGERQRAALAAVVAGRPALVLLDEPTRGMDVSARRALIRLVDRLRDDGASIVLATHDAGLQAAVADRVYRVGGGSVAEVESLPL